MSGIANDYNTLLFYVFISNMLCLDNYLSDAEIEKAIAPGKI